MGNGIAHVAALAGMDVRILDINEEVLKQALETIDHNMQRQVRRGMIQDPERKAALKRIKTGTGTCQFLGEDRRCTVYEGRPHDCRGYVCWNQEDTTVFEFARFYQRPVAELRRDDPDGKPR